MGERLYDAYHGTWHVVGAAEVLAIVDGIPVAMSSSGLVATAMTIRFPCLALPTAENSKSQIPDGIFSEVAPNPNAGRFVSPCSQKA